MKSCGRAGAFFVLSASSSSSARFPTRFPSFPFSTLITTPTPTPSTNLLLYQLWIKHKGLRVLVIFEGRDAAGKGGVIKRLTAPLNQRGLRVVALAKPTETEKTQWYWQRYLKHLPSAGEIVIFDRSWYNRAGVEKVMGWATDEQVRELLVAVFFFSFFLLFFLKKKKYQLSSTFKTKTSEKT